MLFGRAGACIVLSLLLARLAGAADLARTAQGPGAEMAPMSEAPAPAPTAAAGSSPVLPGQLSSKFGIDDARPEASIPDIRERNRNPLEFGYFLQDLLERAEQARKNKDYQGVIRYYRAVAKAVPESAKGWSKLCEAYDVVHDRERAIVACRYALDRPAVEVQDYVRYVHLIIGTTAELGAKDRKELGEVLEHLGKQEGTAIVASHLRCEVAVKLKDVAMMETCTGALAKLAPDDPKTTVFRWSLALMKGQTAEAERLLMYARATGVPSEGIERMESVTPSVRRSSWLKTGIGAAAFIGLAALVAALVVAIRRRRALTGRTAL